MKYNICPCGAELNELDNFCSEECCVNYALNGDEDALLYNPLMGYHDVYGNKFEFSS